MYLTVDIITKLKYNLAAAYFINQEKVGPKCTTR